MIQIAVKWYTNHIFCFIFSGELITETMESKSKETTQLSEKIAPEQCLTRGYRSQPRYKNIVHLWEFLLELLAEDSCRSLISWIRKERGEFKLKNPEEVARRWGTLKGKKGMNYGKLSRALRYYYQQEIIKKVSL